MSDIKYFFEKVKIKQGNRVLPFKEAIIEKIVKYVDDKNRFQGSISQKLGDWLRSNNQLEYAILSIVIDKFPFSLSLYNDADQFLADIQFVSYIDIASRKDVSYIGDNPDLVSVMHVNIAEIIGLKDTINRYDFTTRKSLDPDDREGKTIEEVASEYEDNDIENADEIGQVVRDLAQIFQGLQNQ